MDAMAALAEAEGAVEQSELDAALAELHAKEQQQEEEAHAEQQVEEEEASETDADGKEKDGEEDGEQLNEWQERALAAEAALIEQAVYAAVGGEVQYKSMIEWAGANLPKEQVALYDQVMENGTKDQVLFAVNGLKAMAAMAGVSLDAAPTGGIQEGRSLSGASRAPSKEVFATQDEAFAAMENPLYYEDSSRGAAYRAKVAAKIANSPDFGWDFN
ncbi:hypothetical protein [Aeromonas salmonicida]|uniref:hypothetical protein n=1 Tax=Aeromonas salmonicida TaxID=645 RepID=UPI001F26DE54|nr:hypothetical protein [Aeromonas salmonicida]MCE9933634.1 hypothetical protein [Aeromonas salmonicida]